MRLQKFLAQAGVASRRKAEALIEQGLVQVNGVVVKTLGTTVTPDDEVRYKGQVIAMDKAFVYYLLNKPKGVVSTVSDPHHKNTVMNFVPENPRVYPVGRLDKETTGALILTNDGEFAYLLTHPSFDMSKKYRVSVKGRLKIDLIKKIEKGVTIEGEAYRGIKVDDIIYDTVRDRTQCSVTLFEGKNRQIRKIFAHFDLPVLKLHRFQIDEVDVQNLKIGQVRTLTPHEIKRLTLKAKGLI